MVRRLHLPVRWTANRRTNRPRRASGATRRTPVHPRKSLPYRVLRAPTGRGRRRRRPVDAITAEISRTEGAAREFLIAWNVNLNTKLPKLATKVAAELRETGKLKRDGAGKIVRNDAGRAQRAPGRFRHLQGCGWFIDEYQRAQISFNLMSYRETTLHDVFDACVEEAARLGIRVTGSELVGLVPLDALLAAGDHHLSRQSATTGIPERERVRAAVVSLGLAELAGFDPDEKIIEYRYRGAPRGPCAMSVSGFADELSSDSPAPGGGSVAALCGALAAALAAMVAALTWSKKGMQSARPAMREIGDTAQRLKDGFLRAVDEDTDAFNAVIAARGLSRKTDEERAARDAAIEAANQHATRVPLNVRINLPSVADATVATEIRESQERLLAEAHRAADEVREIVDRVLSAS